MSGLERDLGVTSDFLRNHLAPASFYYEGLEFWARVWRERQANWGIFNQCSKLSIICIDSRSFVSTFSGPRDESFEGFGDMYITSSQIPVNVVTMVMKDEFVALCEVFRFPGVIVDVGGSRGAPISHLEPINYWDRYENLGQFFREVGTVEKYRKEELANYRILATGNLPIPIIQGAWNNPAQMASLTPIQRAPTCWEVLFGGIGNFFRRLWNGGEGAQESEVLNSGGHDDEGVGREDPGMVANAGEAEEGNLPNEREVPEMALADEDEDENWDAAAEE